MYLMISIFLPQLLLILSLQKHKIQLANVSVERKHVCRSRQRHTDTHTHTLSHIHTYLQAHILTGTHTRHTHHTQTHKHTCTSRTHTNSQAHIHTHTLTGTHTRHSSRHIHTSMNTCSYIISTFVDYGTLKFCDHEHFMK